MKPAFCAPSSVELKWNDGKESASLLALCSIRSTLLPSELLHSKAQVSLIPWLHLIICRHLRIKRKLGTNMDMYIPLLGEFCLVFSHNIFILQTFQWKSKVIQYHSHYKRHRILQVVCLKFSLCCGLAQAFPSSSFPPPLLSQAASVSVAHRPRGRLQHR